MQINPRFKSIQQSPTVRTADRARAMEQDGTSVIRLHVGDPDFDTPQPIIAAANRALAEGYTHYSASRGLPELRRALADKFKADNQIEYDPGAEILVTHGASHGIFAALQVILQPGDEVLLLTPSWMTYTNSIYLAGATVKQVPTDPAQGFQFDLDRLKDAIGPKSRVLILNSPSNPTGQIVNREALHAIAELAERHDLYVLADEVYEKLTYGEEKHVSFGSLPGMKARTITINSFSKTYAMTGWRVGYVAAPAPLVAEMLKVTQAAGTHASTFSQRAALAALTDPGIPDQVEHMRQTYAERRARALEAMRDIPGLGHTVPQGAFYFMLNVSQFTDDSEAFAGRFLNEAHVCMVPGTGFGAVGQGWLRMTFAADQTTIVEGLNRLAEFALKQG